MVMDEDGARVEVVSQPGSKWFWNERAFILPEVGETVVLPRELGERLVASGAVEWVRDGVVVLEGFPRETLDLPKFLTKLQLEEDNDRLYYRLWFGRKQMRLSANQLLKFEKFQERFMYAFNIAMVRSKRKPWVETINEILACKNLERVMLNPDYGAAKNEVAVYRARKKRLLATVE